ncbi:protein FAM207A-like [Anneissia japonica]|uniref:protein FAM207A-like n=1 Tax=Anneissia japonica TaxID=1529436 RepID=UPI001425B61D|nr:protein FAM207A-like [Anneissia japonica]
MGKIKRKRSKFHLPASGPGKGNEDGDKQTEPTYSQMDVTSTGLGPIFPTKGLFNFKNFDLANVNTHLNVDNDDTRSFISKKSIGIGQHLRKKDKMKIRHEKWLEKIQNVKTAKKKKADAKKRASTAIVGDLQPLTDALPELSEILQLTTIKKSNAEKHAARLKTKTSTWKSGDRQKLVMNELANFKQVLNHTAFKSNALAAINQHLKNTIQNEKDKMDDG